MSTPAAEAAASSPDVATRVLDDFLAAAREAFGADLRAAVLYGSAAEGRLRATSDVNLLLVLSAFDRERADRLREPLRVAQAAIRLTTMFLLEAELAPAVEAFAVKFADILHRRRVVFGADPLAGISIPRAASVARLRQVLLNLEIRMREVYVLRSLREEQLALAIADAAGPLRASAATLLELEEHPAGSPKEALERAVGSLPGTDWSAVLADVSRARESRRLPPGVAAETAFRLMDLARELRRRAETLTG